MKALKTLLLAFAVTAVLAVVPTLEGSASASVVAGPQGHHSPLPGPKEPDRPPFPWPGGEPEP